MHAVHPSRIPADLAGSPLINEDLAPVPAEGRTWKMYNFAALWVGMSVCIPTYMLAAGLIAGGMTWSQAIFTILLGNLIVTLPMILNGHAGARYGIPFPILAVPRSAFWGPTCRHCSGRWWPAAGSASRPGSAGKPWTGCWTSSGTAGPPSPGMRPSPSWPSGWPTCTSWCGALSPSSSWSRGPRRS